jgi:small subunit ribosomal protein S6
MEKKICSYELLFTISGNLVEDDYKTLCEKFVSLINANATDVTVDEWGKRKLAYPINYENDGFYVFTTFESAPEFPAELERVAGITDGVLRVMVIKK